MRAMRAQSSQRFQPSSKEVLLFQAFRVGDQLSEAPGAKVCLIDLSDLSEVLAFVKKGLLYKLLEWGTCFWRL